ncbi:tRNA (adenosine(37)-N6)-threonylcarbamoyltransferase complex ATPase subunit type 1 TsaE [Robertkochia flava]|uniref:tRNA (adenosine(37)-N6)-threonylcarbamoyltransferase complex ATPase subunit type 1 TsaE n=1 Tax=Robertkochia flava TaxID=3447986 RepID=UPI001CCEBF23|nr:tRNA (adenosine(37)-N6)-threonylcarbamoyltransferase complex ATPase subunit type 1 TsaE [Robertkochia marina]
MSKFSYSIDQLDEACQFILDHAKSRVILFKGAMGAGKTTLIKSMVKLLGSSDNVTSPTFSLVNEYHTLAGPVYHFDLYRLEDEEEASEIGLEEYLYSGAWCFVEWPEKAQGLFPEKTALVDIITHLNGIRTLEIS